MYVRTSFPAIIPRSWLDNDKVSDSRSLSIHYASTCRVLRIVSYFHSDLTVVTNLWEEYMLSTTPFNLLE